MYNIKKCIAFVTLLFLTGCSNSQIPNNQPTTSSNISQANLQYREPEAICEDVLKAIDNRDKEKLIDMFSVNAKNTYDIDAETQKFMSSIDGKIVSVDQRYKNRINDDMSWENGQLINYWIEPCISGIITDTNKQYELHFCFRVVYKDDITREGLMYVSLYEPNNPDALAKIGGLD